MLRPSGEPPPSTSTPGARPRDCDVLIVGSGPAGSVAARALAQRGVHVILADQRAFPRDKVCGDGLISDSIAALRTIGLYDAVAARASHTDELRLYAPSGRHASLRGTYACLPRAELDLILRNGARDAGACCIEDATAIAALEDEGRVSGAQFSDSAGSWHIRARATLLATGANTTTLTAFGLAAGRTAVVAGRAYFEAPPDVAAKYRSLVIAYLKEWCPGYGWIFPGPGNRFNIGVGLFGDGHRVPRLRDFWAFFQERFAPAADIVHASRRVTGFRGAPLRISMNDVQFGRPGLLAIGEAAAVTYAATGEGIGKSMESGLLAAELVTDALRARRPLQTLHQVYEAEFRSRFAARYRAYAVAQSWASHPFILNLLAARAGTGRFAREELEALVAERGDPHRLFSARGLLTALIR